MDWGNITSNFTSNITRNATSGWEDEDEERASGEGVERRAVYEASAVVVLLCVFYLMASLARHCFLPEVRRLVDRWGLRQDLAGASVLAASVSCPDLLVNTAGTLLSAPDLGLATVVGCCLVNQLLLPGLLPFAAPRPVVLEPWEVTRDAGGYLFSLALLAWILSDNTVTLPEAASLLALYSLYLAVLWAEWRWSARDDEEEEETCRVEETRRLLPSGGETETGSDSRRLPLSVSLGLLAGCSYCAASLGSSVDCVPRPVLGVFLLGLGLSVPELVSSWVLGEGGGGRAAFALSLSSNGFSSCLGLGLPWALAAPLPLTLPFPLGWPWLLLSADLCLLYLLLAFNNFTLDRPTGVLCVLLYAASVVWIGSAGADLSFPFLGGPR